MNITLKDVPASLHQRLREVAEESGRSVNKLVLYTLERAFCAHKSDRIALIEQIKRRRNKMTVWLDDRSLESAIEDGRS